MAQTLKTENRKPIDMFTVTVSTCDGLLAFGFHFLAKMMIVVVVVRVLGVLDFRFRVMPSAKLTRSDLSAN